MNQIKYYKQDRYETSNTSLKSSGDVLSFINDIRREAHLRKFVEIDGRLVIFGVEGPIILPNGKFWSISAEVKDGLWGKHHIMVSPNLESLINKKQSFLRLDSGCFSGMVLGDITCDCLEQLRKAQSIILEKGGIIIHIPSHDGRGWQEYKMAHQRIMDETKLDTITVAAKFYGSENKIDTRTFNESALILKALGFPKKYSFDLGTRNPKKVKALLKAGFNIAAQSIEIDGISKILEKNLQAKYKFFNNQKKGKVYARN